MRDYYAQATRTEHLATSLIMRCYQPRDKSFPLLGYLGRRSIGQDFFSYQGELKATRKSLFEERPEAMMEAFLLTKQNGIKLSIDLKGQIRAHLHLINDRFRRSRQISNMFLDILRTPGRIAQVLRDMHHLEFLNQYIPEFKRIFCQVQYDAYHIYTVDIHSIFAVEEIDRLWAGGYAEKKPLLTRGSRSAGIGRPVSRYRQRGGEGSLQQGGGHDPDHRQEAQPQQGEQPAPRIPGPAPPRYGSHLTTARPA